MSNGLVCVRISGDYRVFAVIIGIGVVSDILVLGLVCTFLSYLIQLDGQDDDLFVMLELTRCGVLPRVGSSNEMNCGGMVHH